MSDQKEEKRAEKKEIIARARDAANISAAGTRIALLIVLKSLLLPLVNSFHPTPTRFRNVSHKETLRNTSFK